jgi:ribosomal protein L11
MKTKSILLSSIVAFVMPLFGMAQDCGYYSMTKGMTFAYQNMDAKGKVTSSSRSTCMDVVQIAAGTEYKMQAEVTDPKNNKSTHVYAMRCEGGNFYVDMRNFVDPKSMESFKDMEIKVDSKDMMYPGNLAAGQALPDASITISAGSGGVNLMNMVVNITNRKVAGVESVTVPAGTFECYKITYDVDTKFMFKVSTTVTEYVSYGVGNVKTETFDKKGKLMGTSLLTEFSK